MLSCADREGGSQPLFNKIVPSRTVLLLKLLYNFIFYVGCEKQKSSDTDFSKLVQKSQQFRKIFFHLFWMILGEFSDPYIHLQADHILTNVSLQTPLG